MSEVDQGTGTPEAPEIDATEAESSAAENDSDSETTADEGAEEAPKKVPWFQKRIDTVTAEKWELRRLADQQAAQIAALSQQLQIPQAAVSTAKPTLDQFEGDFEAYSEALTDWKVEQKFQAQEQKRAAETAAERAAREASEFSAKVQKAAKDNPKVIEVASDPTLPVSQAMADVVRAVDNGPDVLLYLDANRTEAARIAALPPHLAAYEMGRLSADMKPAAKPRRNPPPEPLSTLAGASTVPAVDPDKFKSADDYQKWRLADLKAKRNA